MAGANELQKPRRILVCRTDALGDAILTLPVCLALKKAFPQAWVSMLVSIYTHDALSGQPGPDQVMVYEASGRHAGRRGFMRLKWEIMEQYFDTALLVFPDLRISWAIFRARVARRIGTGRRLWSGLYNLKVRHSRARAQRHEADYNLDLVRIMEVEAELIPPRLVARKNAEAWAKKYYQSSGLKPGDKLIILHPGGRGSSANWRPSYYASLTRFLMRQYGFRVLLTGSQAEQDLLADVAKQAGTQPLVLSEPVDLKQLAGLIAQAGVFVSGNTGPMHLAAGLGIPTVSLFPAQGVTGPIRWRPLGKRGAVLTSPARDAKSADRGYAGLSGIKPMQVAEKVRELAGK